MGMTAAMSGGLTWESNAQAFWGHNLFTRCTTSDAIVLFPDPGDPAKPTIYLHSSIVVQADRLL